jgi:hypothetical protein
VGSIVKKEIQAPAGAAENKRIYHAHFQRRGRDIFVEPNRKTKKPRLGRHIPFALKMPLLTELKTNHKIFSANMQRLRRFYARKNFSAFRKSSGSGDFQSTFPFPCAL